MVSTTRSGRTGSLTPETHPRKDQVDNLDKIPTPAASHPNSRSTGPGAVSAHRRSGRPPDAGGPRYCRAQADGIRQHHGTPVGELRDRLPGQQRPVGVVLGIRPMFDEERHGCLGLSAGSPDSEARAKRPGAGPLVRGPGLVQGSSALLLSIAVAVVLLGACVVLAGGPVMVWARHRTRWPLTAVRGEVMACLRRSWLRLVLSTVGYMVLLGLLLELCLRGLGAPQPVVPSFLVSRWWRRRRR